MLSKLQVLEKKNDPSGQKVRQKNKRTLRAIQITHETLGVRGSTKSHMTFLVFQTQILMFFLQIKRQRFRLCFTIHIISYYFLS